MNRSGLQRLVPIILVLIIVGLAIAAMVSLGRMIFSGGSSTSPSPTPVNSGKEELTKTLANRSVRMSVRGPLVANENFRSYTITVSPDARNMTTTTGYDKKELDNEQLPNTSQAYGQLVYALGRAHLMDGTPLSGDANDTRGVCATGMLYEFEVLQGNNTVQKLWTSTCAGSKGSLKASLSQVTKLFQLQIPDFSILAGKVKLP